MKNIALLIPKSSSDHIYRGIGTYTTNLLAQLIRLAPAHGLTLHTFSDRPPRNIDLIHFTYFDLFKSTLPIFKSAATVVSILDVIPLEFPDHYPPGIKGSVNLLLQKLSLVNTSRVITISNYSKIQISKYLNISPDHIDVTHLAASGEFKPLPKSPVLEKTSLKYKLPLQFVLYVGDINWNKNLGLLTQACVDLQQELVIVSKNATQDNLPLNHPELVHFKIWVAKYGSHPLVHRIGFVPSDDLAAIYNLASVYCLPSFSEGFGLTLLEAMSCGTPCVCSDIPVLREVGESAPLYFNPKDQTDINKKLASVLSNTTVAPQLRLKSIRQSKLFNWGKTARLTNSAYQKILDTSYSR